VREQGAGRGAQWDAALYGAAAVVAAVSATVDAIPLQREWARLAIAPYAAAALVALLLALRWRRRPARRPLAVRTVLALAVLLGALVVPLALEVAWRAELGDRLHVQSEVFLTEQGARALLGGRDPYSVTYGYGLLRTYPPGVWQHIPYLPGIFAFGLPRALFGAGPLSDARLGLTLVSLAAALLALRWSGVSGERRLRVLMVLLILPTGARYLVGGGDDIAVLALLLLAVVLEQRRLPVAAGLVAGLAAAIKQTAWPALPLLALAARDRGGRRAGWRHLAAVAAVVVPVVAPFAVWDLGGLFRSVVLFPLGLGSEPTIARGLTLGQLLARPFPGAKTAIAVVLAVGLLAAGVLLAVRRPPTTVATALSYAAALLAVAVVLAPAGRLGYLIYPVNLLVWSRLLASGAYPDERQPRAVPVAGADPPRNGGGHRAGADRAVSHPPWPGGHRRGSAAGDDRRGRS
jgi:Glycosyltransferase family 87